MIDENYVDQQTNAKFFKLTNPNGDFKGYDYMTGKEFPITETSQSVYFYIWRIKNGGWSIIESAPVINRIKELGYDGFYVVERGQKNLGLFDERNITSYKKIM